MTGSRIVAHGFEDGGDGVEDLAHGFEDRRDGVEDLAHGFEDLADGFEDFADGVEDLADRVEDRVEDLARSVERRWEGRRARGQGERGRVDRVHTAGHGHGGDRASPGDRDVDGRGQHRHTCGGRRGGRLGQDVADDHGSGDLGRAARRGGCLDRQGREAHSGADPVRARRGRRRPRTVSPGRSGLRRPV